MIIFRDIQELMDMVIKWENTLTKFYDDAVRVVKNKECKEIVALLRENHLKNVTIIKEIRIEDYGSDEWIRYAPDFDIKYLLPTETLTEESTTKEIAGHILEFEEKMKEFYSSISEEIITRDEKDLFDSMAKFKERQIYEIKTCMEYS